MEGNSSIKLTHRDDISLTFRIVRTMLRPFRPRLAGMPKTPFPKGSPRLSPPKLDVEGRERLVEGVHIYDLEPKKRKERPPQHLYYFAGGGFQAPPSRDHWRFCAELARQLSATYEFSIVSYALAPESPASIGLPVLRDTLRSLANDAAQHQQSICLAGDSSGGNLALVLGFWWAKELAATSALPSPLTIFAMSPAVDLTNSNPDIQTADRADPLLTVQLTEDVARKWAGSLKRDDPDVSPLFDNFDALRTAGVKVHGLIGTYDCLAPDDRLFYQKLAQYGIQGEWLEWKGQMHCFPLAFSYHIRECQQGKDWIVDVLKRNAQTEKSDV